MVCNEVLHLVVIKIKTYCGGGRGKTQKFLNVRVEEEGLNIDSVDILFAFCCVYRWPDDSDQITGY